MSIVQSIARTLRDSGALLSRADIQATLLAGSTKATPVDADQLVLIDSADSSKLKRLTWAALKATLASLYATAAQGAKADTAVQPAALKPVATSGSYNDLTGKPTLGSAAALAAGTAANNVVKLDGSARLPAVDGSQLTKVFPEVVELTASGTWTVPTGKKFVMVHLWGGGGGGASGSTSTGNLNGSFGAQGGAYTAAVFSLAALGLSPGDTVPVTIGAGGAGGAGVSGTTTMVTGNPGSDGGTTSFGSFLAAQGGKASAYNASPAAGQIYTASSYPALDQMEGGLGSVNATSGGRSSRGIAASGGGAGGGVVSSAPTAGQAGGAYAAGFVAAVLTGGGAAGGAGATDAAPTAGADGTRFGEGGGGGGGLRMTSGSSGTAGKGGNGGIAGGGGAGGSVGGTSGGRTGTSGAGGNGGAGFARITAW